MSEQKFHLAQFNIGRLVAPLDDSRLAGFVAKLDEVNAIADSSPGFIWRLKSESGNATDIRPYNDQMIVINFSVWETMEQFKTFAYRDAHGELLRRRLDWFEKHDGSVYMVFWWVEAGTIPTVAEAKRRLEYLREHGDSEFAFTLKKTFPSPTL